MPEVLEIWLQISIAASQILGAKSVGTVMTRNPTDQTLNFAVSAKEPTKQLIPTARLDIMNVLY